MLALAALCASAVRSSHTASLFSDVWPGDPYFGAVQYVQQQGIVSGYADGTFRPDQPVNRAEFIKMLLAQHPSISQAAACAADPAMSPLFADVERPGAYWYGPFLCIAKREGIVSGYPDGTFRGGSLVNAAEAAKIIVQSKGLPPAATDDMTWYAPYIRALRNRQAWPATIIDPQQRLTRGDMALILYRLAQSARSSPSPIVATSSSRPAPTLSQIVDDFVLTGSRMSIASVTPSSSASAARSAVSSRNPSSAAAVTSSRNLFVPTSSRSTSSAPSSKSAQSVDASALVAPPLPLPATWATRREGVGGSCTNDGRGDLLDQNNFGLSADGRYLLAGMFPNAAPSHLRARLVRWDRELRSSGTIAEDGLLFGRRRARLSPQGDAVIYAVHSGGDARIMLRNFRSTTPIVLIKESELVDPSGVQPIFAADGRYVLFTVRENDKLLLRVYDRQGGRMQSVGAAKVEEDGTTLFLPPLPQLLYVTMSHGILRTFDLQRELRSRGVQPKSGVEQADRVPTYTSADGRWTVVNMFRKEGSDMLFRVLVFGSEGGQSMLLSPSDMLTSADLAAEPDDARWQLSAHGMTSDGTSLLLRLRTQGRMRTARGSADEGTPAITCVHNLVTSTMPVDPRAPCAEVDRLFLYDWRARQTQAVVVDLQPSVDRPTMLILPSAYPSGETPGVSGNAMSADGRYVVFMLDDDARENLVTIDDQEVLLDLLHNPAIFLYDRQAQAIERILESTCLDFAA